MRINLKGKCDLNEFRLAVNKKRDGKEGTLTLDVGVEQDTVAAKLGERFEHMAFSSMVVKENGVEWLQSSATPDPKKFVCENHHITINGHTLEDTQPKLHGYSPVKDAPKVTVTFKVPVPTDQEEFISALLGNMEHVAELEIVPVNADIEEHIRDQGELELVG